MAEISGLFDQNYLKGRKLQRDISNAAVTVGISSCAVMLISQFWIYPFFLVASLLGVAPERALKSLRSDPVYLQLLQIALSLICFTLPFIVAVKIYGKRVSDLIPFKKAKKGTRMAAILLGIGFCGFADAAVSLCGTLFEFFGVNYSVPQSEDPSGFFGFLIVFTATAIVPALIEEFACRGIVLGLLKPFGNGFAVFCSAIIFGVLHGNFEQIPFAFTVGLILGFIRIKTGSMNICFLIHFINNAVSVVLSYIGKAVSVQAGNAIYIGYLIIALSLGIIGAVLLPKGEENKQEKKILTEGKKYSAFFLNPAIIAFLAVSFLMSFQYFG